MIFDRSFPGSISNKVGSSIQSNLVPYKQNLKDCTFVDPTHKNSDSWLFSVSSLSLELELSMEPPADDFTSWADLPKTSSKKQSLITRAINDFTFDIGDVEISVSVRDEEITGKVCADAMALASPVWKKFMYPPWNPSGDTTTSRTVGKVAPVSRVDFSTDNRHALLLLLQIVHYQFDKIPAELWQDDFFNIVVLADQYDCHKLLRPWLGNWMKIYDEPSESKIDMEASLFVFWTLGEEERFSRTAKRLVKKAQVNKSGEYVTASGNSIPEPSPPHIFGRHIIAFG